MDSSTITYTDFYSSKSNDLILAEAFEIHYNLNPQFTRWNTYKSPLMQEILKSHDLTHIVFACDTSYLGELKVQSWTSFGVKLSLKNIWKYSRDKETHALLQPKGLLGFIMTHLHVIFLIWITSFKLHKKWVYFEEDKYMGTTLGEIRKEYGIPVSLPKTN